ncbi:MAG: hypothetical protein FWH26_10840 [Oscillospiraceae bacterium]|nr:hypothetical protein [Oscillospiraceae bacterium]
MSAIEKYISLGLFEPMANKEGDRYRAFDPRQIPHLHMLNLLKEAGLQGERLKKYAQNKTQQMTMDVFRRHSQMLRGEMARIQKKLDMIESHASLMKDGTCAAPGGVALRTLPARPILCCPIERSGPRRKDIDLLCRAHGQIRERGNPGCPLGFAYKEFLDLLEYPGQPAQLVSFDPRSSETRPAGEYLVGTAPNTSNDVKSLSRRMFVYAMQNELEFTGPAYAAYIFDTAAGPKECLLQISVQVNQTIQGN